MDFSVIEVDAATRTFRDDVRAWLGENVSDGMVDAAWTAGDGIDVDFHRKLGSMGWAFPALAIEDGGAGLGPLAARILNQALAERHVPVTIRDTTAMVMPAIRQWMSGDTRDRLLARAGRGEICFCLGYTEPDAGSDLAAVRTRAARNSNGWIINGQKMFTTGAHLCDYSFVLARTDPEAARHKGLTMFLVPLDAPGVEIKEVKTLGGERTNMVFYDDVLVDDDHRMGPEGRGWTVLHGPLNAEHRMSESGPQPVEEEEGEAGMGGAVDLSGHILRVYEPALRAAVEWARAPGPDSRRPIDDPRVRDRLAEIELGVVISKVTPGPHGRVVAADLFIEHMSDLLDLLGPAALVPRGDPSCVADGWVEFAHRFAQGCAIYGGTTEVMRNLIAERYLGLNRVRPATT
jgi:alkylation response protein AidB-like acyl-CoA dehydrogenase